MTAPSSQTRSAVANMCLRPLPKREVVKLWASAAHPSARAGGKQLPPDWAAERHQPSDRHFVTGAQPPVPAKSKALLVAQSCYRKKDTRVSDEPGDALGFAVVVRSRMHDPPVKNDL